MERRLLLGELRGCLGVVACLGTYQTNTSVMLLYEFMGGGTLSSVLRTLVFLQPTPMTSSPPTILSVEEEDQSNDRGNVPPKLSRKNSIGRNHSDSRKRSVAYNISVSTDVPSGMIQDMTVPYSPLGKDSFSEDSGGLKRARSGGFGEQDARFYAASIILALKSIHSRGVAHRDVRLANILLSPNGYPKLYGFTRGKKLPYRSPPPRDHPPPMPQYANKASFAKTTKVFDPIEIMAKQAHKKAIAFAKQSGNPLPPLPGPTQAFYQIDAATIGVKEAMSKLTLFYNNEKAELERIEADTDKDVEVAKEAALSMAEKETIEEEEKLKHAKANAPPLLWKAYTMCGEVPYSAPEMLLCIGHDFAVDHWALGCIIHELLTGRTPFADHPTDKSSASTSSSDNPLDIHERILSILPGSMRVAGREEAVDIKRYLSPDLSSEATDLIISLMKPLPEHRLGTRIKGWQEVMEHPWFSKGFEEEKRKSYLELDQVRYRANGGFVDVLDPSDASWGRYQGHGRFVSWDALVHGEVRPPFFPSPTQKTTPQSKTTEDAATRKDQDDEEEENAGLSRFVVTEIDEIEDVPFLEEHKLVFNSF